MTLAGGIRSSNTSLNNLGLMKNLEKNYGDIKSLLKIMAIQKASSRTIDGFQTENQEEYSDTTTMEV